MKIEDMNDKGIVNMWDNKITIRTAINWMNPYWDKLEKNFGLRKIFYQDDHLDFIHIVLILSIK